MEARWRRRAPGLRGCLTPCEHGHGSTQRSHYRCLIQRCWCAAAKHLHLLGGLKAAAEDVDTGWRDGMEGCSPRDNVGFSALLLLLCLHRAVPDRRTVTMGGILLFSAMFEPRSTSCLLPFQTSLSSQCGIRPVVPPT